MSLVLAAFLLYAFARHRDVALIGHIYSLPSAFVSYTNGPNDPFAIFLDLLGFNRASQPHVVVRQRTVKDSIKIK
jgi:hypothetical protein